MRGSRKVGSHGWWSQQRERDNKRRRENMCVIRDCENQARFYLNETFGRRHLCARHWRLQATQLEILERIRSLNKEVRT